MYKIKFGTDGWRAIIADGYTFENLTRVSQATATWLKANYPNPSIMLGYDCRFGGRQFAEASANVFAHEGVKVFISPDFASTPMVSLATNKRQCSAGIVITASHNPPEYSGFKIKGDYGGAAYPEIISKVESFIPDTAGNYPNHFEKFVESRQIEYFDMEAVYINHLKQNFDLPLIRKSGIKIGYDAMYGAGQGVIRKLLPEAKLLHCEINPGFNGTAPEPIEKNLTEFKALIKAGGIDVGLCTDGDADRIGLYDENGDFVDSHHIILLVLNYLHKYKGMTGKVVPTFSVTDKVAKMARHFGLEYVVTPVGFKYITPYMLNENVLIGGEESGGIAVAGHIPERDGIYIGMMIIEMMARFNKKLTDLVAEVYEVVGSFAYQRNDLHLTENQKQAIIARCEGGKITEFGSWKVLRVETIDGFKYHFDHEQWLMIRPSGTEPVLRIYAEGVDPEAASQLLKSAIDSLLSVPVLEKN